MLGKNSVQASLVENGTLLVPLSAGENSSAPELRHTGAKDSCSARSLSAHLLPFLFTHKITNAVRNMEKKEPLYIVDGNVSWHSHSEKQYGSSSGNKSREGGVLDGRGGVGALNFIWSQLFS